MKQSLTFVLAGLLALGTAVGSAEAGTPRIPAAIATESGPAGIVEVDTRAHWYRGLRGSRHGGWNRHGGNRHGWNNCRRQYCGGDRDWGNRHHGWRGHRYGYGYGWGHDNFGSGLVVGGILGLATGAFIAGPGYGGYAPAYAGYDNYDAACARKYRSYDPVSNTFMGYDGYRHRCRLP